MRRVRYTPFDVEAAAARRALRLAWRVFKSGLDCRLDLDEFGVGRFMGQRGNAAVLVASAESACACDAAAILTAFDPEEYGHLSPALKMCS